MVRREGLICRPGAPPLRDKEDWLGLPLHQLFAPIAVATN